MIEFYTTAVKFKYLAIDEVPIIYQADVKASLGIKEETTAPAE